ncbi:MAG: AAA family ATPase, partial [Planctomycetota bacterium]
LSVLGKRSAVESKDQIGYLPEERGVYKKMKVGAFLRHMAALKGVPTQGVGRKVGEWLDRVELPDVLSKKCEELSKGMQQKVQFIASVIHEPELLILDEPFSGLDPVNMRLLRELIREQCEGGRTVIFSTHVMVQAEELCDRIVMIHQGEKVLDDSLADIKARTPVTSVLFEPMSGHRPGPDLDAAAALVRSLGPIDDVVPHDRGLEARIANGTDPASAMREIAGVDDLARVELKRPTLEDIFIGIVKGQSGETEAELRERLRSGAAVEEVDTEEVMA